MKYNSQINLPVPQERLCFGAQTIAKTKLFRLIWQEKTYFFIQRKIKSVWTDAEKTAYEDRVEAFIAFGEILKAGIMEGK